MGYDYFDIDESDGFDDIPEIYNVKSEEYYKNNYKKYKENEKDVVCHWGTCTGCKYYEDIGTLRYDDDTIYGICRNHKCPGWVIDEEESI